MDSDVVRGIASKIDAEAARLNAIISSVDSLMGQIQQAWRGGTAQRHVGWWRDQHRPKLVKAQHDIAGLATSARNNANEQEQASAGSGGRAIGGPSPQATTPVVAPAAVSAGVVSAGALAGFLAAHPEGQPLGNKQCVDVFTFYNREVVGAPNITGTNLNTSAREFYEHTDSFPPLSRYYDRIPVGSSPPQPGDVVVWGAKPGHPDGHIAVITQVSGDRITVIEQNSPKEGDPVSVHERSLDNVLGYLRPKSVPS